MGRFNPTAGGDAQVPNFTGASRGIQADRVQADTSVADLFEGVGQGLILGVEAIDQGIQADIQNEVEAAFTQIDNEFGVGAAAEMGARANEDIFGDAHVPQQLRNAGRQLEGLHAEMQAGRLRESHYWARAQSVVRQLKGRYPGYGEIIDSMVQRVTGVRPANALRRSLFQEWGEGAGDSERRRLNKLSQMASNGTLYRAMPDFDAREASDSPYTELEIIRAEANYMKFKADRDRREAQLAMHEQEKTLTKEMVYTNFRDLVNTEGDLLLRQVMTQIESGEGKPLMQIIAEAQLAGAMGEGLDAETARRLGQAAEAARLQYSAVFDALLNKQWEGSDDPTHTYRRHMSPQDIEAARKEFMAPFDRIERALTHGDLGLLRQEALRHEAFKQDVTNSFIEANPDLNILFALDSIYGAATAEQLIAASPRLRSVLAELVNSIITANRHIRDHTDEENAPNAVDDIEQIRNDSRIPDVDASDIIQGMLDRHINIVRNIGTENELPDEALTKELSYMFNEKNFRQLNSLSVDARRKFFNTVAGPEVTKKMENLRDQGRTELWDMYQTYVAHEFEVLFSEDIGSIQKRVLQPDAYDINWNPQKLRFEFTPNPELSPIHRRTLEGAGRFKELEEARRRINAGIQVVAPIIEANDRNVAVELYRLFQDMGLDEDADPGETTVVQAMMEAVLLQMELAAEDIRNVDLPLIGARGLARLGHNIADFTEPLRSSLWDLLRPFEAPFRSPEERGDNQGDQTETQTGLTRSLTPQHSSRSSAANPALDQRLEELKGQYPEAVAALQNRAEPPEFSSLPWTHRLALRREASALGLEPQEVIDRAHELANQPKVEEHSAAEVPNDPVATVQNNGMLSLLGHVEGTDRGRGYNETLGYGKFTGGPVDLVNMTLDEIDQLQTRILNHPENTHNASPVGRYQFVRTRLRHLRKKLGLRGDEKYTEELQDRLAMESMRELGLERWQRGELSDRQFLKNLSREWAPLPNPDTGRSFYGGRARVTTGQVLKALHTVVEKHPEILRQISLPGGTDNLSFNQKIDLMEALNAVA